MTAKGKLYSVRAMAIVAILVVGLTGLQAHSPTVDADADVSDWCFATATRPADDTGGRITCDFGEETVWFDAQGDNLFINDVNIVAVTTDETNIYFAITLWNDPAPESIPSGQVAIDIVDGGNEQWRDLEVPPSLINPNVGQNATSDIDPDYLIVFDFANFLIGGEFNAELLQSTTVPGDWTSVEFLIPGIFPGELGGSGGDPGRAELAIPFADFACDGCPAFGPDTPFKFTFMTAQGDTLLPFFAPSGPIEDLISEEVAGTFTTTTNSCPIGGGTTSCELSDMSSDAFLSVGPAGAESGEAGGLAVDKAGADITLTWGNACLAGPDDAVYEGTLASLPTYDHVPLLSCTTAGAGTATFTPAAGNTYYLVVPNDGSVEGSYGKNGSAAQRPVSTAPCATQVIADECL